MIKTVWYETPFGWLELKGSTLGLSQVSWKDRPSDLSDVIPDDHPVAEAHRQMKQYFAGTRRKFDLKLDLDGASDFYKEVWKVVRNIPYGSTMAYSEIAEVLEQPKAVRAVGMANRNNRLAIVIPCHRVIGKAGELRGYFYGLDVKMSLLRHENPVRFAEQGSLF